VRACRSLAGDSKTLGFKNSKTGDVDLDHNNNVQLDALVLCGPKDRSMFRHDLHPIAPWMAQKESKYTKIDKTTHMHITRMRHTRKHIANFKREFHKKNK
jgi:hypothetical protein